MVIPDFTFSEAVMVGGELLVAVLVALGTTPEDSDASMNENHERLINAQCTSDLPVSDADTVSLKSL